jgi:hypothetical protein
MQSRTKPKAFLGKRQPNAKRAEFELTAPERFTRNTEGHACFSTWPFTLLRRHECGDHESGDHGRFLRRSGATSLRPGSWCFQCVCRRIGRHPGRSARCRGRAFRIAAAEDEDQVLPAERCGMSSHPWRAWALRRNAAFISGGGSSSASMASIRYSAACWRGAGACLLF